MKLPISSSLYILTTLGLLLTSSNFAQPNKQPAQKITQAKMQVPTKAQMQKAFPKASGDLFNKGQQVTVFWIERGASSPGQNDFHGYHIRGEQRVRSTPLQRRLKADIEQAIATDHGFGNSCFNPVYGLRVSDGSQSVDLLPCFSCHRLVIFSDQAKSVGTIGVSGDIELLLNRVLRGSIQ